jgi:small GTP-binding protein
MTKKPEIIKQLEKEIGKTLKQKDFKNIGKIYHKGFAVDENGNVIGLNLDSLKLKRLPDSLATFHHLKILSLYDNILTDVSILQSLNSLNILDLNNNQLADISSLQGLSNLTRLNLRHNYVTWLPEKLLDLEIEIDVDSDWSEKDKKIYLYGNPLETPPIEIIKKGKEAIRAYFNSLKEAENLPLNEVKVLLVGDGGAGKTSLVKRMLGYAFDENESQTHGINIDEWKVTDSERTINVHLWDFGGQQIMLATHQFFLSKRSLYILVLDGRKDEEPEYWLKNIESFGGDSLVLVVINKIDQNPGFEVNRKFLQEKYKNIKGFFRISCKENEGIPTFSKALKDSLLKIEIIKTTWAANWFNVKERLEKMEKHYISYKDYQGICTSEKITDKKGQETLVEFLNDLGVVLHFKDLELKDTHVLEPRWVTEAVYKIINSRHLAEQSGVLDLSYLDEILKKQDENDYDYPPDKYCYIIELTKKFELCYQLDRGRVLIPDLLKNEEPVFDFDYDSSLKFVIQYDFLPKSVMPRFIVRMNKDIKNQLQWRTGVVLEDNAYGSIAVVKSDERDRKIFIYVNGKQKRDYFFNIRKTLRDINNSFEKLDIMELIPLPDNPAITVDYEELIGHEQMGKKEMFIGKIRKSYDIDSLISLYDNPIERERSITFDNRSKQIRVLEDTSNIAQMDKSGSQVRPENELLVDRANIEEESYLKQTLKVPKEFQTAIKQYLVYFNDFVRKAKGMGIKLEIHTGDDGLDLLLEDKAGTNIPLINKYLSEYTGFIKENIDNLAIFPESNMSDNNLGLLMIELRAQIRNLKTYLETIIFTNNRLKDDADKYRLENEVEYLRYQLSEHHRTMRAIFENPVPVNLSIAPVIDIINTVNVDIDMKVDLPAIQMDFSRLKEELESAGAKDPKLNKELDMIEESLDELTLKSNEKEHVKRLNKLQRLLKKLGDENSHYNKMIRGTKKGIELLQKVGSTYNKFAQWLALPQVPDVFLGNKRTDQ